MVIIAYNTKYRTNSMNTPNQMYIWKDAGAIKVAFINDKIDNILLVAL